MVHSVRTINQSLFQDSYPPIVLETSAEDAVDARLLRSFLGTVTPEGAIGVSAAFRDDCQLSSIAFSSLSRALVVKLVHPNLLRRNASEKQTKVLRGRKLLQEQILCNASYQKYTFRMDRFATALYLDMGLRIVGAVDMLSVSTADRRSLQALMNAMGGELTLQKGNVKALFRDNEGFIPPDSELALQAWAACRAATLQHMTTRFHGISRIDTNALPEVHLAALAKISRDGELLDSLKPMSVKNDITDNISADMENVTLKSSRFPTRIRTSRQQFLEIETQQGSRIKAHALKVAGRQAQIIVQGSVTGDNIKSITTVGKADLTPAEAAREKAILETLKGESSLLSQPFFKTIWLPRDTPSWPQTNLPDCSKQIYCSDLNLNTAQEAAVEKILSSSDENRTVLIQGPPGTGKTTVIAASITSIIFSPNAANRTIWVAAQSNVAVKNIAEKLDKIGFRDFRLLVSWDFHFDWHEHLYERLEHCLLVSDVFCKNIIEATTQLGGARVILCTLSMLSNDNIAPYVQVNPVDILIFDEGSQIEIGDYVPVLHRYAHTLTKMVFIGDHKQLAPYGQESIPTLQSIFEVKHLRKTVLFLNTQYRMPSVVGNFISNHVYNGKLKTCHQDSIKLPCRFVNVERGEEEPFGHSWINTQEARIVVHIARVYQSRGDSFRIITPYDGQRSLIKHDLESEGLDHEDKVFNVDSFQGNEAEHIIVSVVRSDKLGFLVNQRRTNVMLTRCKKTMVICTTRAFVSEMASSTLIGQLAATLGPQAWVSGKDIERTSRALPRRVT